jgi:hypothetical protein
MIRYNGEWVTVEEYQQIKSGEQPSINIPPANEVETPGILTQAKYIYEDGVLCVGGDNKPIVLIDNPDAKDVSYEELISFIVSDSTDEFIYEPRYVCADFAEKLHNNAEAFGIRAAWVGIDFEDEPIGHAINAFRATDKGIVYIDCTGKSLMDRFLQCEDWESVAYVEIGKPYGIIPIAYAGTPYYDFYEQYTEKCYEYEQLLDEYNAEILRYYDIPPEDIEAWEAELEEIEQELDELGKDLADCWAEPGSIVSNIILHWEPNG